MDLSALQLRIVKRVIITFMLGVCSIYTAHAQNKLTWLSFEKAILEADSTRLPIMVDVWAPWCGWCKKMEQEVYPQLKKQLGSQFVITRLNRDDNNSAKHFNGRNVSPMELAKKFKITSVPGIVFLNANGEYLMHISGFIKAKKLTTVLNYISSDAYRHQSFNDFQSSL